MLTARGDDMERIVGLEIGADDYLPKPFNPRELVARLRAILRRIHPEDEDSAASDKVKVDEHGQDIAKKLKDLDIPLKEKEKE